MTTTRLALHGIALVVGAMLAFGVTNCSARPSSTGPRLAGWLITVYYTAVESYHVDPAESVRGCSRLECERGDSPLGEYPKGFVDAVQAEGTGRITSGPNAGRYLNWSHNLGYWLDDAPRDSRGERLEPFVSAAADPDVLAAGTNFTIAECGTLDSGEKPPDEVCERIRSAHWTVRDEFTPGLGGPQHIDIYIGEEQGPDFTASPWYLSLKNAVIALR
ncbi:RlpA-like double-psi beta-barrel domain-containing protein [Kibdelosporangium aridum]|uniref:Uncharacterized protein n=1 Tax=Kibdelosporangium aridum TaxID=2030 RepID=A0A1Y5XX05_KIBAR|nr:hypothetical protein [Kibdelosporangium aridum]SMD20447.1 hypothetical protein SAMN05661093_06433 [Kibdelosporangium aridum]